MSGPSRIFQYPVPTTTITFPTDTRLIVTSSTRPVSPVQGQSIYETDTGKTLIYVGSTWIPDGNIIICTSTTRPGTY